MPERTFRKTITTTKEITVTDIYGASEDYLLKNLQYTELGKWRVVDFRDPGRGDKFIGRTANMGKYEIWDVPNVSVKDDPRLIVKRIVEIEPYVIQFTVEDIYRNIAPRLLKDYADRIVAFRPPVRDELYLTDALGQENLAAGGHTNLEPRLILKG